MFSGHLSHCKQHYGTTIFKQALKSTIILLILGCTAQAGAGGPQTRVAQAAAKVRSWIQEGEASWYGKAVQGHRTASGERFDMNAMVCAHRTLPLGSWLRVTNLSNRKSVLVRVIDRGPLSTSRVVDLSYAAAHAVGIGGVGQVRLEPLNPSDPLLAASIAVRFAQSVFPRLATPSPMQAGAH